MKRLLPLAALFVSVLSFAGQVCTIDPPRPAASTGFYVVGAKLYDPDGNEFRIRGTNWGHLDQAGGLTGIPLSGANAVRMVTNYTPLATTLTAVKAMQAAGLVVIPSVWTTTCKSDPASLSAAVDGWVAGAPTWAPLLNTSGLLNIANEWGPINSTVWRDENIKAIARLRAAGYTSTLVVDSGGCGQDPLDVVNYGAAVLASDPLKNVLFDVHVYGVYVINPNAAWKTDYVKSMAALKATGLPIFIGEFGPGNNVGSSPTTIPPQTVIATAEANGWGWMPWSWDDNNLTACQSSDGYFALAKNCGKYTGQDATELSTLGKLVVPLLKGSAKRAAFVH